jgi:predicted Rossmann fold nucleotide-binding protein DprA/Smf involved in DNA uptake
VSKRLQRNGNSLDLRLTSDLLFALGLEVRDGNQPEVEIELVDGGLLIRPVDGVVASSIPPVLAAHPTTRELLLAVRDLAPVRTMHLAAALDRTAQAVSDALVKANKRGWVERGPLGWALTEEARPWFEHVPARKWPIGPDLAPRLARGTFQERCLEALGDEALSAAEVADRVEADRAQAHRALQALVRDGLAVVVPGRPTRWRRAPSP